MIADFDRDFRNRVPQRSKPLREIGAILAVERGLIIIDVELHAPAVELDFVNQSGPTGGIFARVGAIGRMNGTLRSTSPMWRAILPVQGRERMHWWPQRLTVRLGGAEMPAKVGAS